MSKYSLIVEFLKGFEHTLDDNHEVWLKFSDYNEAFMLLETITGCDEFIAFALLSEAGEHLSVIQNYSQLNFQIFSKLKAHSDKPARRIGFQSGEGL